MKQTFLFLITLLLFFTVDVSAQLKPAQSQYLVEKGVLINPSFEQGYQGWVITGCTKSLVSETPFLNKSLKLTCTNETFSIKQVSTLLTEFESQQGSFDLQIKTSADDVKIASITNGARDTMHAVNNSTTFKRFKEIGFIVGATDNGIEIFSDVNFTGEIIVDNLKVGLGNLVQEISNVTNWEDFTATGSWVANTTYEGKYRRIGDSAEITVYVSTSGAPTATTLTIDMPSNLTIDSDKLNLIPDFAADGTLGSTSVVNTSAQYYSGVVSYISDTTVRPRYLDTSALPANINATTPFNFGFNDSVKLSFTVPIEGWSATQSTIVAQENYNQEVFVKATGNTGQTVTVITEAIEFGATETVDKTSSWNGSVFTAPETGRYLLTGMVMSNALNLNLLRLHVNATFARYLSDETSGNDRSTLSTTIDLNKGDTAAIHSDIGFTVNASSPTSHYIEISKITQPPKIIGSFEQIENITGDIDATTANELSAKLNVNSGVISSNYDWIDSCVDSGAPDFRVTCTFNTDIFTQDPTCTGSIRQGSTSAQKVFKIYSTSPTNVSYMRYNETGTKIGSLEVELHCSKQGADVNKSFVGAIINASTAQAEIVEEVLKSTASDDLASVYVGGGASAETITGLTENIKFDDTIRNEGLNWDATERAYIASKQIEVSFEGMTRSSANINSQSVYTYIDTGSGYVQENRVGFTEGLSVIVKLSGKQKLNIGDKLALRWNNTAAINNTKRDHWLKITETATTESIVANLMETQVTKCQTKYLSANTTSTGVIADLTFNNLKLDGTKYEITGQIDSLNTLVTAFNNAIKIGRSFNSSGTEFIVGFNSGIFNPTASIVTFEKTAGTIYVDSGKGGTWIQLCELPETVIETTEFN